MSEREDRELLLEKELRQCRERTIKLEECFKTSGLILSSLELEDVLRSIMTSSRTILKAEACSLFLVEEATGELVCEIAQGPVADRFGERIRIKKGEGIAGSVYETGASLRIEDAYADSRFEPAFDRMTGFRTQSILCAPLKVKDRVLGVTQVINRIDGKPFAVEDEDVLSLLSDHAAIALENARMHQALLRRRQMEHDLEVAAGIQQSFLPMDLPAVQGYRFLAHSEAALQIGGDLYDFIPLDKHRLGILIGDISGKGIAAALFMARLTSDFRFAALKHREPARVMADINDLLFSRAQRGMFATLFYAVLDHEVHQIEYVNAGHLPPIFWNSGVGKPGLLPLAQSPPAGILPGTVYDSASLELAPGDHLLLCTDGVIEAKSRQGERLGWERVLDVLTHGGSCAEMLFRNILEVVCHFSGNGPRTDDTTMVMFGREGAP